MLVGCYGWIAYAVMALVREASDSAAVQAGLAGLLGAEAWALLDTVGAHLLWWSEVARFIQPGLSPWRRTSAWSPNCLGTLLEITHSVA